VRVLATPVMINLIEAAALAAIEHFLPAGYQSLGTHLDVRHLAATPVGMRVIATAEVTKVDGRTVFFRVNARDEIDLIGDGSHERGQLRVARQQRHHGSQQRRHQRVHLSPPAPGQGRRVPCVREVGIQNATLPSDAHNV